MDDDEDETAAAAVKGWPPPYEGMIAAPAGEPASAAWRLPSTDALDWTHKALQVLFLLLALAGLGLLLGTLGPRSLLRGIARKHTAPA